MKLLQGVERLAAQLRPSQGLGHRRPWGQRRGISKYFPWVAQGNESRRPRGVLSSKTLLHCVRPRRGQHTRFVGLPVRSKSLGDPSMSRWTIYPTGGDNIGSGESTHAKNDTQAVICRHDRSIRHPPERQLRGAGRPSTRDSPYPYLLQATRWRALAGDSVLPDNAIPNLSR